MMYNAAFWIMFGSWLVMFVTYLLSVRLLRVYRKRCESMQQNSDLAIREYIGGPFHSSHIPTKGNVVLLNDMDRQCKMGIYKINPKGQMIWAGKDQRSEATP